MRNSYSVSRFNEFLIAKGHGFKFGPQGDFPCKLAKVLVKEVCSVLRLQ